MSDTLLTEMTGENTPQEENPYEVKKKMTGDHLWSTIIDSNFLTYMLQFDQCGEYCHEEWASTGVYEEGNWSKLDPIWLKMEEEMSEIVELAWNASISLMSSDMSQ